MVYYCFDHIIVFSYFFAMFVCKECGEDEWECVDVDKSTRSTSKTTDWGKIIGHGLRSVQFHSTLSGELIVCLGCKDSQFLQIFTFRLANLVSWYLVEVPLLALRVFFLGVLHITMPACNPWSVEKSCQRRLDRSQSSFFTIVLSIVLSSYQPYHWKICAREDQLDLEVWPTCCAVFPMITVVTD